MSYARRLWIVPCLFFAALAQAEDLKTADEVIAKYVEAVGGRTKLDAIKTMRVTAKAVMYGGMEVGMVVEGVHTAPIVRDLARQLGLELPITEAVCAVLEGASIHDLRLVR